MSEKITITKLDEAKFRVSASPGVAQELCDHFAFRPPNYNWHPAFRSRAWDGFVRIFQPLKPILSSGHKSLIASFCEDREYDLVTSGFTLKREIDDVERFCRGLNPNSNNRQISHHDYQIVATQIALEDRQRLLLSPTASGKSLIIYTIARFSLDIDKLRRLLIVVPTIGLVKQMQSDFADYSSANGWDAFENTHLISGGADKNVVAPITISTWQSIYEMPPAWFAQFDGVIVDEAHTAKAKSLTKIMDNLVNAVLRIGTTGTLDDCEINKLVLVGHFGEVYRVITTRELMDSGKVSNLHINPIVLSYDETTKSNLAGAVYNEEIDFIARSDARAKLIGKLVSVMEAKNGLIAFNLKRHGELIKRHVENALAGTGRKVYLLHGDVAPEERERVRLAINKEKGSVLIASFGVFQLGVNVPNLHYAVFASPFKGKIRNLQTIGRAIRKADDGSDALLFDLIDDLKPKKEKCYGILHAQERMRTYLSEKFDVSSMVTRQIDASGDWNADRERKPAKQNSSSRSTPNRRKSGSRRRSIC